MAASRQIKANFTAGELAPELLGRGDLRAYANGARRLRNVFIQPTGGVTRRPGLRHVASLPGPARLLAFEFNTEQTYLLVFTGGALRVFLGDAEVAQVSGPWAAWQLPGLAFTQTADTLLICHPEMPPQRLTRTSHTSWILGDWNWLRAPTMRFAPGEVSLTPSGTSGLVTVTASGPVFGAGHGMRMEACSPYAAVHTANAQDHVYEVAWASQGYLVEVLYGASATRVGAVVRGLHQAAAHREFTREIASVPNLRAAAFRWNATQTGFDKLACLSSNVGGSPATLADFAFPGLEDYVLTSRGVVLPGGRGLGFVVDARRAKEFALAVDADNPRLVVQCFDASMNLLTSAAGQLVRASGMSVAWNATAKWWQGSADLTDADLTRLQVLRLEGAVAYAIIGVARIGADYEVRAMYLSTDPAVSPPLLYGLPDLRHGARELVSTAEWDPPAIAAGASAQLSVSLAGVRPGDFAQAAFSLATSGVVFLAQIGAQDVVSVTAWNRTGAEVNLAAGTVRVRVVKS